MDRAGWMTIDASSPGRVWFPGDVVLVGRNYVHHEEFLKNWAGRQPSWECQNQRAGLDIGEHSYCEYDVQQPPGTCYSQVST